MSWSEIAVVVVAVLAVVGWFVWVSASRLDRLHRKVMASRLALDAQLVRRASAALDLAVAGALDPASSVLVAEAAHSVIEDDADARRLSASIPGLPPGLAVAPGAPRETGPDAGAGPPRRLLGGMAPSRAMAESDLSATLRSALEDPDDVVDLRGTDAGDELLGRLAGAWYRAQLARRFHNEAVAQAQWVRHKWWVRALRLAGHAPMPTTVELDDAWPEGLGRPVELAAGSS